MYFAYCTRPVSVQPSVYVGCCVSLPFLKVLRSLSCMLDGRDMFSRGIWAFSTFSAFRLAESLCRKCKGEISSSDQTGFRSAGWTLSIHKSTKMLSSVFFLPNHLWCQDGNDQMRCGRGVWYGVEEKRIASKIRKGDWGNYTLKSQYET